jgi:UDP-glucose 4-epimerase
MAVEVPCNVVVVTGGAGFIGTATTRLLQSKGIRVVVVDNLSSPSPRWGREVVADLISLDIRSPKLVDELLRKLERSDLCLIHLAALVSVEEVRRRPLDAITVNVTGTLNVLEAARRLDVDRLVYASSVAVYGEPVRLPIDEDHPRNPVNLYGATKLLGEILVEDYARTYGISYIVLRYFNVYGPGMKPGPYSGVVYRFIEAVLTGSNPTIYGDGFQTRDFVYVEDVAYANLLALKSRYQGPVNIGSGRETSIRELLQIVSRIAGVKVEPTYAPPRPGDVRRSWADIRRASEVLNWRPRVALEDGLRRTIEYYRSRLVGFRKL